MGTIFFSDLVCCGTNLTCINTLTVICVILNPSKPMSLLLGSNWIKNPQEATAELFDALCVDLQIEAFAECLKGESKSNNTLQTVSDLYEILFERDDDLRIVATDKEIEELMLKLYKELFELLDEAERSKAVQITRKVTMLLDLKKPPLKETLTHNVRFILQDAIRDIEHYAWCHWTEQINFKRSLSNLITISMAVYFTPSVIAVEGKHGVSTTILNENEFNDVQLNVTQNTTEFDSVDLMKIQVERFCRSLLSLSPFLLPPVDMISCRESLGLVSLPERFCFRSLCLLMLKLIHNLILNYYRSASLALKNITKGYRNALITVLGNLSYRKRKVIPRQRGMTQKQGKTSLRQSKRMLSGWAR